MMDETCSTRAKIFDSMVEEFAQEVGARIFLEVTRASLRSSFSSLADVPVDPDGNNSRQK